MRIAGAGPRRRGRGRRPATSTSRSWSPRTSASSARAGPGRASSRSPRPRRCSAPRSRCRRSTGERGDRGPAGDPAGRADVLRGPGAAAARAAAAAATSGWSSTSSSRRTSRGAARARRAARRDAGAGEPAPADGEGFFRRVRRRGRLIRPRGSLPPEQAELVLAELVVLAPERGRGGARAAATSSTRSTAARGSCRSWASSRRRSGGGLGRGHLDRDPRRLGRPLAATSTSRCWSATGSGCGPPGRSRARARSTSSSTPARPSAPAPTRPRGSALSCCSSSPDDGRGGGALADLGDRLRRARDRRREARLGAGPRLRPRARPLWRPRLPNASANGVELELLSGSNLRGTATRAGDRPSTANLTAPVLRDVAARIEEAPASALICSGLLASRAGRGRRGLRCPRAYARASGEPRRRLGGAPAARVER